MNFLLLDFGASRIKSIVYNSKTKNFSKLHSTEGPFVHGQKIPKLSFFSKIFLDHINYQTKNNNIDAINICCEMHGFILADKSKNLLDANYVSWRCSNKNICLDDLKSFFPDNNFKEITGMNFKDGLPVSNILKYINTGKEYTFMGICECLISIHGKWYGKISKSIASSTGFYNIKSNEWVKTFKNISNIKFPEVSSDAYNIYGFINIHDKKIPVYGCIGDLQASLLSFDLNEKYVNVNLGTGSQVSKKYKSGDEDIFELRPIFDNDYFTTVSHIPCGRTLFAFSNFFNEISKLNSGKQDFFWEVLFSKSDIDYNKLWEIDLNIFKGSYKYKSGGAILNINEENLNPINFIHSLKISLVKQYSEIIDSMQEKSNLTIKKILLTGALSTKISDFSELLTKYSNIETEIINKKYDSTIIGLSRLSDKIAD